MNDHDDSPADTDRKRFTEFDCPDCSANNPIDDGFYDGDEIRCLYCGIAFKVTVSSGRLRLAEV
jgi:DNA-directed RNA polymerase subunit RPC12/RpoP